MFFTSGTPCYTRSSGSLELWTKKSYISIKTGMIILKVKRDEVFGKVIYEDLWTGITDIIMFGKSENIILSIYGEENEEFTSNQKDAFSQFRANMSTIVKEAEAEILKYYLENFEDYRAMQCDNEELETIVPQISSIEELRKLVSPTHLLIRYDFEDGIRRVGILCDCTWEPEHGLGVSIENEKIIEIGFRDIVL